MKDTSDKVSKKYIELIMKRTGEDRLKMGCSMYDTAKQIIRSSILSKTPRIEENNIKKEIFLRFYGQEFNREKVTKIFEAFSL